jgi:glycosyltransferase involved in cell wall biosynthesis
LPEAVAPLSGNLVLPSTGVDAIADGLIGALNGSLKLPTEQECRLYARENFDTPVIAKRVAAVYSEAIQAGVVH